MRLAIQNPYKWHEWFAWHPVQVEWEIVWLEKVERRLQKMEFPSLYGPSWEYRSPSVLATEKLLEAGPEVKSHD